jgi:hypothetical protein
MIVIWDAVIRVTVDPEHGLILKPEHGRQDEVDARHDHQVTRTVSRWSVVVAALDNREHRRIAVHSVDQTMLASDPA